MEVDVSPPISASALLVTLEKTAERVRSYRILLLLIMKMAVALLRRMSFYFSVLSSFLSKWGRMCEAVYVPV